ncbi:MAG: glucose-6-phosphate isomerase [bacterium TMED88]|nr:glucose-6-phosphate isomerase [Deltaproteobacteria bacterium]OUV27392.1 MAG: glucose-6-phosphate isomerase [bacterium TMED88]
MENSAERRTEWLEWKKLIAYQEETAMRSLAEWFEREPERVDRMQVQSAGLFLDYSKNRIDRDGISRLLALADRAGLPDQIANLMSGEVVNASEGRPALHRALRASSDDRIEVGGVDVVPAVQGVLARMALFCDEVRSGRWTGYSGRRIRHVINLGIGGSDLGPRMACQALRPYADSELEVDFVSNVDGRDIERALVGKLPSETLFIICSKTFTTQETLMNAQAARAWVQEAAQADSAVAQHFVAVSTNAPAVEAFGIRPENMFEFWDWVGGRYSLTSAVGLSLMLAIGPDSFQRFLTGARAMDQHFSSSPLAENMPVVLGLLGVFYRSFYQWPAHCIVPYSQDLGLFPAYLQQLDMESNGKGVDRDGYPLDHDSGPILFGDAGTNVQHAFFQMLHQGTQPVPCDFLSFARTLGGLSEHQDVLTSHCLAQAEALAFGQGSETAGPQGGTFGSANHRFFPGSRPSNVLLARQLSPEVLGALVALYEHKVFVQGVIWGVNSFDQWGVELGKALAGEILKEVRNGQLEPGRHDASTSNLLSRYLRDRNPS